MRGPTVVHRRTSEDLKGKHRLSALHLHEGIDVATALNWTVSSVEDGAWQEVFIYSMLTPIYANLI